MKRSLFDEIEFLLVNKKLRIELLILVIDNEEEGISVRLIGGLLLDVYV